MRIANLIPRYRDFLSKDEVTSVSCMNNFLFNFETVIIKPNNLRLTNNQLPTINFPDQYFTDISAYSSLLLKREFYESLIDYDYVLIYQLDCLVFSSELQNFCELGYDYIGAPLFQRYQRKPILSRVGNGGFSLRRVKAFLEVLNSKRYIETKPSILNDFFRADIPDLNEWSIHQRWLKKLRILRSVRMGVREYVSNYKMNEDLFWSDRARLFDPGFKIAPMDVALKFAFDKNPQACYEMNNHQLPFGAHAWAKWDREFWEQFLPK